MDNQEFVAKLDKLKVQNSHLFDCIRRLAFCRFHSLQEYHILHCH